MPKISSVIASAFMYVFAQLLVT